MRSRPHVARLDLCRRQRVESPQVHTLSSISAMVQLVEQGFGVATLPQAAVARLATQRPLCTVRCDAALAALQILLNCRDEPAASAMVARRDLRPSDQKSIGFEPLDQSGPGEQFQVGFKPNHPTGQVSILLV